MKKRIISVLVLAAMLLTILPVTALATDELVSVEAPEAPTAAEGIAAEEIAAEEIPAEEVPAEEIIAVDEVAVEEAETYLTPATDIVNPRIVSDSSMEAGQKVTYDCVWFGSYPQAEVVNRNVMMTTAIGEDYLNDDDYIVDATLYSRLMYATGWVNDVITIDGNKYRRMLKADATGVMNGYSNYYNWSDSTTYHYFKYQPIKWRVLTTDGSTALLLADECLDDIEWNTSSTYGNTWATSKMHSWLNSYGDSDNAAGIDYSFTGFLHSAFTSTQKSAIVNSNVKNNVTGNYTDDSGTATTDTIFLLSLEECKNAGYGFSTTVGYYDEARRAQTSTYARARGASWETRSSYLGNSDWWLRSAGNKSSAVCRVDYGGSCNSDGYVPLCGYGVRPALKLKLTSSGWSYAGTVCTDGTAWQQVDGKTYYYDTDGTMATGWQEIDGKTYYFENDGAMVTGWKEFDSRGNGKWRYFLATGEMATGWEKIEGKWYYFDNNGYRVTGWKSFGSRGSEKWCYFLATGEMAIGRQVIDGKTYFFDNNGYMVTGWKEIGIGGRETAWRYFLTSGEMVTGWQVIDGKTYYFDNSGNMATGWQEFDGKWYYFGGSGYMKTGWYQVGSKWYYFNSDGVMQTGWKQISGKWYYLGSSGAMKTGWQKIEGKWYYFQSSGAMKTGWLKLDGKWYYLQSSGVMKTGWLELSGKWYWFNSSGVMAANESVKIGTKTYHFDANGVCTNP